MGEDERPPGTEGAAAGVSAVVGMAPGAAGVPAPGDSPAGDVDPTCCSPASGRDAGRLGPGRK